MLISDKDIGRFMSKIKFFEKDKCWEWTGAKHGKGYGHFRYKGKIEKAHRFSYLIAKGDIQDKMQVCHQCDNPKCVNPYHLWLGTNSQNQLDSAKKGRQHLSRKTHCPRGHELKGKNLYMQKRKSGGVNRVCRECKRIMAIKYYYLDHSGSIIAQRKRRLKRKNENR